MTSVWMKAASLTGFKSSLRASPLAGSFAATKSSALAAGSLIVTCTAQLALVPPRAFSDEYERQVKQIQADVAATEREMERLGLSSQHRAGMLADQNKTQGRSTPLIQFVDAKKTLVAPPGKILWGVILERIVLSSEPHPVRVKLDRDQGIFSRLIVIGIARPSSTQGRIQFDLDRMVLSTGGVEAIAAVGVDEQGSLGIVSHVLSSKALATAGALGTGILSGVAAGSQTLNQGALGFTQTEVNPRNALLQGLAQAASDQSKRLIEDATKEKPILTLEPGAQVGVLLQSEVRL